MWALSVYVLSYGLILTFLSSYFWDDWVVYYRRTNDVIEESLRIRGDWPTRAFLELTILGARPELFKIITLIAYFVAGWFLFQILNTLNFLRINQIRLISILFLILPINSARVAMVDFAYACSLLLFFWAWFLLVRKSGWIKDLLAVLLFLLSFGATASLLVFLLVPCAHRLYLRLSDSSSERNWASLSTLTIFLMSPTFWFLDRRFNSPQGSYLAMYSLQKSGVVRALILFLIACIVLLWWARVGRHDLTERGRNLLISLGIILVIVGAAPYIVAGHLVDVSEWMFNFVPRASDWSSRHQLLLGLGLAVIIVGILGELESKFKRNLVFAIVGVCVLLNMTFMQAYFLDSLKQDQFIDAIKQETELSASKVIMIDDQAERFNARGRFVRYYEWDAMFASAYGNDSKQAISGLSYVDCASDLIPDTLLTITATNGRLKATLLRDVGINIAIAPISPCP
jgi:low affinity Fe/Cu permease